MAKAKIYRPAKNPMQSGKAHVGEWLLEYKPEFRSEADSLIGWNGSRDMRQEIKLHFDSCAEAVKYAETNEIKYDVQEPHKPKLKIQSYADNFTS